MNLHRIVVGLLALGCAGTAFAAGSGEYTRKNQTTKLPNAYAFRHTDHFDAKKTVTSLMFSTVPVDAAKAAKEPDAFAAAEDQVRAKDGFYVQLDVDEAGNLGMIGFFGPGLSMSGGAMEKPVFTRRDDKHVAGTFRTRDEKEKSQDFGGFYDLTFDVDVTPSAAK